MLIVAEHQSIQIGGITAYVLAAKGGLVQISFDAPEEVPIARGDFVRPCSQAGGREADTNGGCRR